MVIGVEDTTGKRISEDLLHMGWNVIGVTSLSWDNGLVLDPTDADSIHEVVHQVGERTPYVDMLVINIDGTSMDDTATILDELNYEDMIRAYEINSVGPMRVLYAFMPLLDKGEGKRICFVTTDEGSNSLCFECGGFGRHLSKAALNMAANLEFNGLRPQGYTMRMYCKDLKADSSRQGAYAAEYFTRNRSYEAESFKHSDENRLTLRDSHARELPW